MLSWCVTSHHEVVNLSLSMIAPSNLKIAALEPGLKKPSLDHAELKNFSPISNLNFLSKITEKIEAEHIIDYISKNMAERLQSACNQHHSSETA